MQVWSYYYANQGSRYIGALLSALLLIIITTMKVPVAITAGLW